MWPNPHESTDLVAFTDEILNGKLVQCFLQSSVLGPLVFLIYGYATESDPLL